MITSSFREEICEAAAPGELARAIRDLPTSCLLMDGACQIFFTEPGRIPPILMREIGRERERAFRAAGEGSGKACDLDEFDPHYGQLFAWDSAGQRIAGGYRMGRVDEILRARGPAGLYTATLFDFDDTLLHHLSGSLEMGRSFVSLEFQKHPMALYQLWRGIARVITRDPRYHRLFGPVSISDSYSPLSKQLMVRFLKNRRAASEYGRAQPRQEFPLHDSPLFAEGIETVEALSAQIAAWEPDGKGVPVLLRHYLRLNSVALGFNVDPAFANAIDVLILTDLRKAPDLTLRRMFGEEAAAKLRNLSGGLVAAVA